MFTKYISCKLVSVPRLDFSNKTSGMCSTLHATVVCLVFLAPAVAAVATTEVCGGIRNRFICDDHDPSVFHICLGNNQYTMVCPGTLHFNLRTQNCDWPDSVNCVQEALSRQPSGNTDTVPTDFPTSGTKQLPVTHRGDHSSPRSRVLPTSTSFPHSTTSQVSNTVHTTNTSKVSSPETGSTEAPHSRYRLKVVPSTDKPLESLLPADEKVIEEVKKLSEELKHIDNYLQSLESDKVGFMIEPYMAAFQQKRLPYTHRYPKLETRNYTTSSVNPFRKSSIQATSPFRRMTSQSPYRINTATHYRSKSTSNPRTHRVSRMASTTRRTFPPYRSKETLYLTDYVPAAYKSQDALGPASRYSYRFANTGLRNSSMGHFRNPYKDSQTVIEAYKTHGSKHNMPASSKQYAFASGKREHRFGERSTSRVTYRTHEPHNSTAMLPSTNGPYRNQGTHRPQIVFDNKTTRKSQMPYANKTTQKSQMPYANKTTQKSQMPYANKTTQRFRVSYASETKHKPQTLPIHKTTQRSQRLINNETTRKSQSPFVSYSTRRLQTSDNKTTRKAPEQNDYKTARFQSTRSTSTYKQPSIYKSTPMQTRKPSSYISQGRAGLTNGNGVLTSKHPPSNQAWWSTTRPSSSSAPSTPHRTSKTTVRTSPRHYSHKTETSYKPVGTKGFTSAKSSTTSVSNPWWSSTKYDHTSVSHPDKSAHRGSRKYTQRHYPPRPNYNTRTPNLEFVLEPGNERAISYRSRVQQSEQKSRPVNAAAAVERSFALHRAPEADERSFSLYQVNAPASVDRFALHKPQAGLGSNEVVIQTDTIVPLEKHEEDQKDKVISAYKSPVEKYETKPGKCSSSWCKLPDCRCIGADIPGDLAATEIPQMVMLTFDDSINSQNMHYFRGIFNGTITNPNDCPIKSTFFVSGDSSDYDMVKRIYKQGHEIASHTLSHRNPTTWWAYAGYENWEHEIVGMRERLHEKSGVPVKEITGMRAPFLQVGGDSQYAMLKENKFRYDSSMVTGSLYTNNQRPIWPFTLDTPPDSTTCSLTPCPTRSYPGLWEVPLIRWYGSNKMACAMPDACTIGLGTQGTQKFMEDNFKRHYTTNRAPFGIFIHASWFGRKDGNFQGLIEFLRSLADKEDVWVVTVSQALDWIQHPVRLSALNTIESWAC